MIHWCWLIPAFLGGIICTALVVLGLSCYATAKADEAEMIAQEQEYFY